MNILKKIFQVIGLAIAMIITILTVTVIFSTTCDSIDRKNANNFYQEKNYSTAAYIYSELLKTNTTNLEIYELYADVSIAAEDYKGALEVLNSAPDELKAELSDKIDEVKSLNKNNKSVPLHLSNDYTLTSTTYILLLLLMFVLVITGYIVLIVFIAKRNPKKITTSINNNIHQNAITEEKQPIIQPSVSIPAQYDERDIPVPARMEPHPLPIVDESDYNTHNDNVAYFRCGVLFNVSPRTPFLTLDEDIQVAHSARYIISDSIRYDLEDPQSIKSIKIPHYNNTFPTRDLGYILRMRASNEKRIELAVPLVYKAISIMLVSHIRYGKKDYFRLIAHLWTLGEIKYADHLLSEIKKRKENLMSDNYSEYVYQNNFEHQLNFANTLNQDYILSGNSRCVPPESAPYCNRLYCISGKDKRFPKLPDFIIENKGLHGVDFYSQDYYDGYKINIYTYDAEGVVTEKEVDAIEYSNRPFIDDRPQIEKDIYEIHRLNCEKKQKKEDEYFDRQTWINRYYGILEYKDILKFLPNKAPKSFDGYMRMRNNSTENFKKLVNTCSELGVKFYL